MRISIQGLGHVGLPTAAVLASNGHEVVGIDRDAERVAALNEGRSPFYEPGLDDLLGEQTSAGRLTFSSDVSDLAERDVCFICVGTPPRASGEANLVAVERAAADIARFMGGPVVIADKSTVPSGTAERIKMTVARERPDAIDDVEVVSNPEFLREGRAVEDSLHPDRIVVGAESERAFKAMRKVYEPLMGDRCELIETDIATAELAKHACNAFLATKISFANALARLCERAGANINDVTRVMGGDSRIGAAFLGAGLGYGGYCFPKDVQAFERLASGLGYDFALLREVARINDEAVEAAFEKIRDHLWNLEGKKVTILGLSFKPETDDVRFSPPLALAARLLEAGAEVTGYDPAAAEAAIEEVPGIATAGDPYEASRDAHCVVFATEWSEVVELDLDKLKEVVRYPVVLDGRNILDPARAVERGFTYLAMGMPNRNVASTGL